MFDFPTNLPRLSETTFAEKRYTIYLYTVARGISDGFWVTWPLRDQALRRPLVEQPARAPKPSQKSWVRSADAARFLAQKETSCVEVQPSAELAPRPCRLLVTRWGRLSLHY